MRRMLALVMLATGACSEEPERDEQVGGEGPVTCAEARAVVTRDCADEYDVKSNCEAQLECPEYDQDSCFGSCDAEHSFDTPACYSQCDEEFSDPVQYDQWLDCKRYTCDDEADRVLRQHERCIDDCYAQQEAEADCSSECDAATSMLDRCFLEAGGNVEGEGEWSAAQVAIECDFTVGEHCAEAEASCP